jgi:hypothetical protein
MLIKFFIIMLLSSNAWSATTLLEKRITSGRVLPSARFIKECKIFNEGFARITSKLGNNRARINFRNVSRSRILWIQSLLRFAQNGRIELIGATCDAGSKTLHGYIWTRKIILDEDLDCGTHKINRSRATPVLQRIARQTCGF